MAPGHAVPGVLRSPTASGRPEHRPPSPWRERACTCPRPSPTRSRLEQSGLALHRVALALGRPNRASRGFLEKQKGASSHVGIPGPLGGLGGEDCSVCQAMPLGWFTGYWVKLFFKIKQLLLLLGLVGYRHWPVLSRRATRSHAFSFSSNNISSQPKVPTSTSSSFSRRTLILLRHVGFSEMTGPSPHFTDEETGVSCPSEVTLSTSTLRDVRCSSLRNGLVSSVLCRRIRPWRLLWPVKSEREWRVPPSGGNFKSCRVVPPCSLPLSTQPAGPRGCDPLVWVPDQRRGEAEPRAPPQCR